MLAAPEIFLHQDMWHAHRCEQQTESWSSVRVSSLFPLTQLVPVKHSVGPGRAVCPYLRCFFSPETGIPCKMGLAPDLSLDLEVRTHCSSVCATPTHESQRLLVSGSLVAARRSVRHGSGRSSRVGETRASRYSPLLGDCGSPAHLL